MRRALRRGPTLGLTLFLAMLGVALLSVGAMLYFSDAVVQREVRRLPPEVQDYLRAQRAAQLRAAPQDIGAAPATAAVRPPADPVLGPYLLPGQNAPQPWWGRGGRPARNADFVRRVQGALVQVGVVAALASAGLAWLLSRRVARRMVGISRAARALARGNLAARAPAQGGEREFREVARAFNEMAEALQTLEHERRQAVADIAHELRTPLAVMQARLDALEDGVFEPTPEQLRLLSAQTQLLTRLVDDLRTLSLLEVGRLKLRPMPTDLAALAAQVTQTFESRALQRGVALEVRAEATEVQADPDRVRQILVNLIENALRHAQTRVEVRVQPQPGGAVLGVDDDGPGIPPTSRETVFRRFARLDESRGRDTGGSGLGLAIVHALAEAHGGRAEAGASETLGGASLRVHLPWPGALPGAG